MYYLLYFSFSERRLHLYNRMKIGILCILTVYVEQFKANGHHGQSTGIHFQNTLCKDLTNYSPRKFSSFFLMVVNIIIIIWFSFPLIKLSH